MRRHTKFIKSCHIHCIPSIRILCGGVDLRSFSFKQCNNMYASSKLFLSCSSCVTIICYKTYGRPTGRCTTAWLDNIYDENTNIRYRKIEICERVCESMCANTLNLLCAEG